MNESKLYEVKLEINGLVKEEEYELYYSLRDALCELTGSIESEGKKLTQLKKLLAPEWVDVKERLPEEDESVLVSLFKFNRFIFTSIGYYYDKQWRYSFNDSTIEDSIDHSVVAYWMPLPDSKPYKLR